MSGIDEGEAQRFLASGRLAVVGASDREGNFGSTVVEALRKGDIPTVAVHPAGRPVAGADCYRSVAEVAGRIDGAIVMVPPTRSAEVVAECIEAGVPRIWLFKGAGAGAVSDEAVRLCAEAGVGVIAGACPLMFLEPVRGVHRLHRVLRRANRSLIASGA